MSVVGVQGTHCLEHCNEQLPSDGRGIIWYLKTRFDAVDNKILDVPYAVVEDTR